MKTINLLFTIFLLSYLCSCSEKQSTEPETQEVSVWAGESFDVSINSNLIDCNYILTSKNKDIATASFDNKHKYIHIDTYKSGVTQILLINTDNNNIIFEISVHSNYFHSFKIIETDYPPNKSKIIVKATNVKIQKEIEEELLEEKKQTLFSSYKFNEETKDFTVDKYNGIKEKGNYEWSISFLKLKFDNRTEKYNFKIAIGRKGYIIEEDKTKKYQQLYPNAGIIEVYVTRIWQDLGI